MNTLFLRVYLATLLKRCRIFLSSIFNIALWSGIFYLMLIKCQLAVTIAATLGVFLSILIDIEANTRQTKKRLKKKKKKKENENQEIYDFKPSEYSDDENHLRMIETLFSKRRVISDNSEAIINWYLQNNKLTVISNDMTIVEPIKYLSAKYDQLIDELQKNEEFSHLTNEQYHDLMDNFIRLILNDVRFERIEEES